MSIGLDIGTKTIKVIELEKKGNSYALVASGVVGYRGQNIEKLIEEKDVAAFAEIIQRLFKSAGIGGKDVAIALPEPLVFTRTIRLPLLTDQEVASAIKWEAEQYIPIPIKEAIIQHQILQRVDSGPNQEVVVLLVAAPRTLVDKFVNVLSAAKINVNAVETELMSMVRALAPRGQTSLVIDFGARSVDCAIAYGESLTFSRSIPTAGEALTRALTQSLKISEMEAEQYKRAYGLSESLLEGKIRAALEPVLASLVDELKKAIHFYQSEEKGQAPSTTIISGGSAGMPELISYLSNALGTEVLVANPFSKISLSQNTLNSIAPYAPLYSIAVGLAMR